MFQNANWIAQFHDLSCRSPSTHHYENPQDRPVEEDTEQTNQIMVPDSTVETIRGAHNRERSNANMYRSFRKFGPQNESAPTLNKQKTVSFDFAKQLSILRSQFSNIISDIHQFMIDNDVEEQSFLYQTQEQSSNFDQGLRLIRKAVRDIAILETSIQASVNHRTSETTPTPNTIYFPPANNNSPDIPRYA